MSGADLMPELDDALGGQYSYTALGDWASRCAAGQTDVMRRLGAKSHGYENVYRQRERWQAIARVFGALALAQERERAASASTVES